MTTFDALNARLEATAYPYRFTPDGPTHALVIDQATGTTAARINLGYATHLTAEAKTRAHQLCNQPGATSTATPHTETDPAVPNANQQTNGGRPATGYTGTVDHRKPATRGERAAVDRAIQRQGARKAS